MISNFGIICFVLTIRLAAAQIGDKCSLRDGEGICDKVVMCDVAVRSILESGSTQLPRCGFEGITEIVCCPQKSTNIENRVADRECKIISEKYGPPTAIKVIGGKKAAEGEFPHMVAVAFARSKETYFFGCGGSLISDRHVLTAAHCVFTVMKTNPAFARVGVLDISDNRFNGSTDYVIDTTIVHPDYKRPRIYHDIAILRLKTQVVMSDVVFPACLYTRNEDPVMPLDITGWGVNNVGRSATSNVLLKGKLSLVPNEICMQSYTVSRRYPQSITSKQLCAQDITRNIDACQGDSGGPLQALTDVDGYYRLIGVTSHGIGCATSAPGVYTRINKYLDWIEGVAWPSD